MQSRKKLIVSAIAAATAVECSLTCYDLSDPKFILNEPYHGKRGKKGKAKKDWQK